MRIVRTWVNSWATSDRYDEPCKLPCLFGCTGKMDVQSHYVRCPILYGILSSLRPTSPADPRERIGLLNPNSENLLSTACTCSGYHALRRSAEIRSHLGHPSSLPFRTCAVRIFAEMFFCEALELKLPCLKPFPRLHTLQLHKLGGAALDVVNSQVTDSMRVVDLVESHTFARSLSDGELPDTFPIRFLPLSSSARSANGNEDDDDDSDGSDGTSGSDSRSSSSFPTRCALLGGPDQGGQEAPAVPRRMSCTARPPQPSFPNWRMRGPRSPRARVVLLTPMDLCIGCLTCLGHLLATLFFSELRVLVGSLLSLLETDCRTLLAL